MSYLSVSIYNLRIQFYCGNCYDDEEDSPTTTMEFGDFINQGVPCCDICDEEMEAEYILIPPSEQPEENHI